METTPEEALLQQVWEASGNVELLRSLVTELEPAVSSSSPGIVVPTTDRSGRRTATEHPFLKLYNEERERLVRFSKACIDAGVSQRLVRLAERQGELIAAMVTAALGDSEFGLSVEQQEVGKGVFARHLKALNA